MATLAPDAPDAPKVVSEKCELVWTLGHRTDDDKVSTLKFACAACKISGGALGVEGARQLAAKPIYHRGVKCPPPADLVKRAYGNPGSPLKGAMISMNGGYSGSTRPWE